MRCVICRRHWASSGAIADPARPAVNLIQVVIAYVLAERTASVKACAFLYAAVFMRFSAGVVSLLNPNDEACLGLFFGLAKRALLVLVAEA